MRTHLGADHTPLFVSLLYSKEVTKPSTTPLARRLADRTSALGITRAELARRLDQKPGNVSRWLTGRVRPTVDSLRALADALETTVDALLEGEPCPATVV